jgi:hypothetical protein
METSFIEMHRLHYEFQAILSATVCSCIPADQTLSFTSLCGVVLILFYFYDNEREIGHDSKFKIINLQIYRTTLHTPNH